MPRPLVAIVSDRAWFFVDVYARAGNAYVKKSSQGPFETTVDQADSIVTDANRENPGSLVNAYVFDANTKRWKKWR